MAYPELLEEVVAPDPDPRPESVRATVRRRGPSPARLALTLAGALIALCMILPILVLIVDAHQAGWHEIHAVVFRQRSYTLMGNTIGLTLIVTVCAAVIGTLAAYFLERTTLPLRRVSSVLVVLPMAMPDFVVGYSWHTMWPRMSPQLAAATIMTIASYPLVYLPVAGALRRCDPRMEDIARSLGLGPIAIFARVTLPLIRPAVLGGSVLVALTVLSEYGAFEVVRFHTFTTEIFTEFQFDPPGAAALAIPLVMLALVVIGLEALVPRRRLNAGAGTAHPPTRARLGLLGVPATIAFLALVGMGVVFPVATLIYWMQRSTRTTLPAAASLTTATVNTVLYCAFGAILAVALAFPLAFLSTRYPSRLTSTLERSVFTIRALPGVVIALSLVFLAINYVYPLYQTSTLLVVAYAMLFFPLGLVCMRTSVQQIPRELAEVARSLGRGRLYVFARVTLPLLIPGITAGLCLVFVTATTELTTTLVLSPIGMKTLATQFWAFQSDSSYGAAAPYALVTVAVAVVPGALIGLWFDRVRQNTPQQNGTAN